MTKHKQTHNNRDLDFEVLALETRLMMAGDVTAKMIGSDVVIHGDGADNKIAITQEGARLRIQGNDTLINGTTSVVYLIVRDDLKINLKGGDNDLRLGAVNSDLTIPGDLNIRTSHGNDDIAIYRVRVGDDLRLKMGSGRSDLLVYAVDVADDMSIATKGESSIAVYLTVVQDDLKISTGHARDAIDLQYVQVKDDMTVVTRGGNDTIIFTNSVTVNEIGDDLKVSLGHGNDVLNVAASIGDHVTVHEGHGTDSVNIYRV